MKVSKKTRQRRKSVKALDDDARQKVFDRDGYRCIRCGTDKFIQWAHVITRRNRRIKWLPENGMTLCAGCHKFWWHAHPAESGPWFRDTFPDRWALLMSEKDKPCDKTDKDLREMAEAINAGD